MSSYTTYRFLTHNALKEARKHWGNDVKHISDNILLSYLINEYDKYYETTNLTPNQINFAYAPFISEYSFMKSKDSLSISVSRELVEFVEKCEYDIQPDAIKFPCNNIIMHFPSDTMICGIRITGSIIITNYCLSELMDVPINFFNSLDLDIERVKEPCSDGTIDSRYWAFFINSPIIKTKYKHGDGSSGIVGAHINHCDLGKTIDESCMLMETDDIYEFEKDYFDHIRRLACRVLVYAGVFPECIKEGVPDKFLIGTKGDTNTMKTKSMEISVSDSIRDIINHPQYRTAHFRCGHFRTLVSEFFKLKKGQTVFVRPTFVGLDVKHAHIDMVP